MEIISILIPIFLVLGLGAASVYSKIFSSEDSYIFSKYDYYIGFPILIFYSLSHTDFEKVGNTAFLLANSISLATLVGLILICSWLFRVKREFIGVLILAGIFGNVAYMGIPLNELLFGKDGVGYASIIVGIVSIFCLSVGIFFLEYFSNAKPPIKNIIINTIKSPIIIAVFAGGIASALSVSFPAPIENFLSLVSKSASPIALFAVGMFMAGKRISSAKGKIFTLCLLNLLALPIITYGIGWIFGLTGVPLKVSFLEAAMPLAVTNFVIAQKYKLYEDVVASAIVISTIVSIITIGAGMLFIQS